MVGYLNTIPLVYGLRGSAAARYNLHLETPAQCFNSFMMDEVDVALVPVGTLPLIPDARIVTDVCIGCKREVRTVCLFSNVDIHQLKTVYLDIESRTSVLLIQILMKHHWKRDVVFIDKNVREISAADLPDDVGVLMIGDKVFEVENDFVYKYDLGAAWYDYTGLPFAFAVWVAKPHVTDAQITMLNTDLLQGITHVPDSLLAHKTANQNFDLDEYFECYIDYHFDENKRMAMKRYLEVVGEMRELVI